VTGAETVLAREPAFASRGAARLERNVEPSRLLFWLLLLYFVLEYLRPPGLPQLKLQMIFILVLPLLWLTSAARPWSRNLTLQLSVVALCAAGMAYGYNNFAAYLMTRAVYGFFVAALAITWILGSWRYYRAGVWAWVLIMSYQALYSLRFGGVGTGGFIGDENDLALACGTVFPFGFVGFRMLSGWKRWACAGVALLFATAVVVSFSRGGFLGLAAGAAYCVFAGRHRARNLAIGLGVALVFFLAIPSSYKHELSTIRDASGGTAEARRFLWTAAFNMWLDHPILGVGAGSTSFLIGQYQPDPTAGGMYAKRTYQERDWSGTVLHSGYFDVLSQLGLVGCALFMGILVGHFRVLRRLRRDVADDPRAPPELAREVELHGVALAGAMAAFLVAGAFVSVAFYPYLWYFSAMAVALDRAARRQLETGGPPEANSRQVT